jgi:hypothetical protein
LIPVFGIGNVRDKPQGQTAGATGASSQPIRKPPCGCQGAGKQVKAEKLKT